MTTLERAAVVLGCLLCGCSQVGKNGADVGGPCATDNACDELCLDGESSFEGGMCTFRCESSAQCPKGTACVDFMGRGICAVLCTNKDVDCRDWGRDFECDDWDLRTESDEIYFGDDEVNVCLGDKPSPP